LVGGLLGLPLGIIVQRQRRQIKERYCWCCSRDAGDGGDSRIKNDRSQTARSRQFIAGSIQGTRASW
jgi:hypothetical protein